MRGISHMNAQTENALRSVAKQCRREILDATCGIPRSEHDPIITSILDKYAARIAALPPGTFSAKRWLCYYVRCVDAEARQWGIMEIRDDTLIDMKFMMQDSCFGKTFFYSEIKAGRLPPPKKIGRSSRWEYRDYKNWKSLYDKPTKQESNS